MTDEEYRWSLGTDYIFFEITEPEQLAYTYKVEGCKNNCSNRKIIVNVQANPATFSPSWNHSHTGMALVPSQPSCGCGHITNADMIEGHIALIQRGDCSFVSKVT